jgi:hypothetical protein
MRAMGCLWLALTVAASAVRAQIAEPIQTNSAVPFEPGSGGVKLDFASGIGRGGGTSQTLPEGALQVGLLKGLEALVRFPLLRIRTPSAELAVVGGGHLAVGARYLLSGGAERRYAISSEVIVETPTGDTRLDGNATEVTSSLLAEWHPRRQLVIHSNLRFEHSFGGTGTRTAFLEYASALAWLAARHVVPALEFVGSTDTISGRTELIVQPELIFRAGPHWELKAGLQRGLNDRTPPFGVRAQVAWFWGARQ